MDERTVRVLARVTGEFYERNASSFELTRRGAWPGWERVRALMGVDAAPHDAPFTLLDVGCGNLRFERFIAEACPGLSLAVHVVDNCAPLALAGLAAVSGEVAFHPCDVVDALLDGAGLPAVPPCDAAVAFGLMHHLPGQQLRTAFARALCAAVHPGGVVAFSLWRFLEEPSLRERADASHEQALCELHERLGAASAQQAAALFDEGDRMVGWQNRPGAYRYCHSFSAQDVDELVAAVSQRATVLDRFTADGRNGELNAYVVLQVE